MTTTPPKTESERSPIRTWGIALSVVLILCSIGFGAWYCVKRPPTAKYDPIIAAVVAGTIQENEHNPIDLPADLHGITDRDQLLVSRRKDGSFVICFPTSHPGTGQELVGLLYTSRPLTDADTLPNRGAVQYSKMMIRCGSYDRMSLDDKINDHWWHVSAGLQRGT